MVGVSRAEQEGGFFLHVRGAEVKDGFVSGGVGVEAKAAEAAAIRRCVVALSLALSLSLTLN